MKILIIDTSTSFLYVKFYDNELNKDIFDKSMESHNNHSENLLNVIEEGLKINNMKLKDFDKVIVGKGPGSYTGLRVGMVVAKMTAFSLNIPMYTISSLQFIGSGYFKTIGTYAITSIAKKDYCYGTIIKVTNDFVEVLVSDEFKSNSEFYNVIKEYNAILINETNYSVCSEYINNNSSFVSDIHNEVPNYLRLANS